MNEHSYFNLTPRLVPASSFPDTPLSSYPGSPLTSYGAPPGIQHDGESTQFDALAHDFRNLQFQPFNSSYDNERGRQGESYYPLPKFNNGPLSAAPALNPASSQDSTKFGMAPSNSPFAGSFQPRPLKENPPSAIGKNTVENWTRILSVSFDGQMHKHKILETLEIWKVSFTLNFLNFSFKRVSRIHTQKHTYPYRKTAK